MENWNESSEWTSVCKISPSKNTPHSVVKSSERDLRLGKYVRSSKRFSNLIDKSSERKWNSWRLINGGNGVIV
jgi:hypothetical protein